MVLEGTSSSYNGKNRNAKEINKGKEEFIQRHTDGESLAEAVIIGKKPYFAVALPRQIGNSDDGVSIVLKESIPEERNGGGLIKPPDPKSYINRPYVFKSKEEFDPELATDVPHASQESQILNGKYDNGTRKDEGMRL